MDLDRFKLLVKRKKFYIPFFGIIISALLLYFLWMPSRLGVEIKPGLVKVNVKGEINTQESSPGSAIQACTIVKPGCAGFVGRPFSKEEWEKLTSFEMECVETGCLQWGLPAIDKQYKLTFTNEEATSLVNTYRPKDFPLEDIRLKFQSNQIIMQAKINMSIVQGYITITADSGPAGTFRHRSSKGGGLKILDAKLGKIPVPLPSQLVSYLEEKGNRFLTSYPSTYYITLYEIIPQDGKVEVQFKAPEKLFEIVSHENQWVE